MSLSSYFWRFVHRVNDLESERDGWKHEAEKQIRLASGANAILEQHIRALMKERDELRQAAAEPDIVMWAGRPMVRTITTEKIELVDGTFLELQNETWSEMKDGPCNESWNAHC